MVQKKATKKHAGRQTPNLVIPKLAKLLFQFLQCLHHLGNIGSNGKGITAKAFLKKQQEMDSFVRPAQEVPGSQFRTSFKQLTQTYFQNTLDALVNHYQARLDTLRTEILKMGMSTSDFQKSMQIALKWGRKNFRSKLKQSTLNQFHCAMEELCPDHMSFLFSAQPPQLPHSLPKQQTALAQEPTVASPPTLSPPPPISQPSPILTTPPSAPPPSPTSSSAPSPTSPIPPPAANPLPTPTASSPSTPTQNVQGFRDCLSNFFPCAFNLNGIPLRNRSVEHNYQYIHAVFSDRPDIADEISKAPNAYLAKKAVRPLKNDPSSGEWDKIKRDIMRELLWEKTRQISLFRETLLASHPKRLTHILPPGNRDSFWATEYMSIVNGKTFPGQDVFAELLMEIRESLLAGATPPTPQSTTNRFSPLQALDDQDQFPALPQARGTPVINRILSSSPYRSPITTRQRPTRRPAARQSAAGTNPSTPPRPTGSTGQPARGTATTNQPKVTAPPPLISSRSPTPPPHGKTNPSSSPRFPAMPHPTGQQAQGTPTASPATPTANPPTNANANLSSPHRPKPAMLYHPSQYKNGTSPCPTPTCSTQLVILGDSNVNRITQLTPPSNTVNSVEFHSYSGAKFVHFQNHKILPSDKPQPAPKMVILSVGINNHTNADNTNREQIKKSISAAKKYFPEAKIYIPKVNYSPKLLDHQKKALQHINQTLDGLSGSVSRFGTIPTLPAQHFHTNGDLIHWTTPTANAIYGHWLSHLN